MQNNNNKKLPCDKHLQKLGALSLEKRRLYADLTFIYMALHGLVNYIPFDFALTLKNSCKRDEIRLTLHGRDFPAMFHSRTIKVKVRHFCFTTVTEKG